MLASDVVRVHIPSSPNLSNFYQIFFVQEPATVKNIHTSHRAQELKYVYIVYIYIFFFYIYKLYIYINIYILSSLTIFQVPTLIKGSRGQSFLRLVRYGGLVTATRPKPMKRFYEASKTDRLVFSPRVGWLAWWHGRVPSYFFGWICSVYIHCK